jgi:hypothetical protein
MNEEVYTHLKNILLKIQNNSITVAEQNSFVHLTRVIIQSHLHSHRFSYTHLIQEQGLTETDLAYDCISEVFARNGADEFFHLNVFIGKLSASLVSLPPKDIFLAYKSFILHCADKQLARLFTLNDGAGAKIKRNICNAVRFSSCCILRSTAHGTVLQPQHSELLLHLPAFPPELLAQQFFLRLDGHRTAERLLNIIIAILVEQESYRRTLPLVSVVQLIKKVFPTSLVLADDGSDNDAVPESLSGNTSISETELDDILAKALLAAKKKIFTLYLLHEKLTIPEAEALFLALRDWLEDVRYSKEILSLEEYFTFHHSVDDATYAARIASKMEYMQHLMRQNICGMLDEEI